MTFLIRSIRLPGELYARKIKPDAFVIALTRTCAE